MIYANPILIAAAVIPAIVLLVRVEKADRLEKESRRLLLSLVIFGVVKFGLGTLFGFPDSAVNLSVGVILILSVLVPNLVEDIQNRRKVAQRRAETAKLNAAKA